MNNLSRDRQSPSLNCNFMNQKQYRLKDRFYIQLLEEILIQIISQAKRDKTK